MAKQQQQQIYLNYLYKCSAEKKWLWVYGMKRARHMQTQ